MDFYIDSTEFEDGLIGLVYESRGTEDRGIAKLTADQFAETRTPVGVISYGNGVWLDFTTGDILTLRRSATMRRDVTPEEAATHFTERGRTLGALLGYLSERFTGWANNLTMQERYSEALCSRVDSEHMNAPAYADLMDPGQWHVVNATNPITLKEFTQRHYDIELPDMSVFSQY